MRLYTTILIFVYRSGRRDQWAELRRNGAIVHANPGKGEWDLWIGSSEERAQDRMCCYGEGFTLEEAKRRAAELIDTAPDRTGEIHGQTTGGPA